MPHQAVPLVECLRVHTVHMPHQARQIGLAGVQHQMKVIAHLAIAQHLSVEAIDGLREHVQLPDSIFVVPVDGFAAVTARGHVIESAGELDAQRSGHVTVLPPPT